MMKTLSEDHMFLQLLLLNHLLVLHFQFGSPILLFYLEIVEVHAHVPSVLPNQGLKEFEPSEFSIVKLLIASGCKAFLSS